MTSRTASAALAVATPIIAIAALTSCSSGSPGTASAPTVSTVVTTAPAQTVTATATVEQLIQITEVHTETEVAATTVTATVTESTNGASCVATVTQLERLHWDQYEVSKLLLMAMGALLGEDKGPGREMLLRISDYQKTINENAAAYGQDRMSCIGVDGLLEARDENPVVTHQEDRTLIEALGEN